jgi:nucleoside-diphosphate-sugar epimerase
MKILITGGAGYIGTVLIDMIMLNNKLIDAGVTSNLYYHTKLYVTVIDNLSYKQNVFFEYSDNPYFRFVYGDVRNEELLEKEIKLHDVIIPLACIVGMPACKERPLEAFEINEMSVKNITKYVDKQMIIYPTTNSGYGIGEIRDGKLVTCDETTALNPLSIYGETKVNAENHLLKFGNAVTLRLATVFGMSKRMRLDLLVNDFTYKAFTDSYITLFESDFKRNYIHIKDVAKTFLFVMNNYEKMKGQAYNIGLSSANLSKMELCEIIKTEFPKFHITTSNLNSDIDKRNYIVSNKKIENLGWVPEYNIIDGVKELKNGYNILFRNNRLYTNL